MLSIAVAWANALVAITLYLGTGYVVFVLGHSGWWFLAAVVISVIETQTVKWTKVGDLSHTEAGR